MWWLCWELPQWRVFDPPPAPAFHTSSAAHPLAPADCGPCCPARAALCWIDLSLHRSGHQLLLPIVPPLQLAAFLPAKGRFVADETELEERPKGPLQDPRISILEPKKVGGVHWGRQWREIGGGCSLATSLQVASVLAQRARLQL